MTYRIADTTRSVAFAAAGTAVIATADLLDRQGPSAVVLVAALGLLVGAFLLARTRQVALTLSQDTVVVQGLLSSRTFDAADVVGITTTSWNSFIELADGRSVMTLLREDELGGLTFAKVVHVTKETADARELVTA